MAKPILDIPLRHRTPSEAKASIVRLTAAALKISDPELTLAALKTGLMALSRSGALDGIEYPSVRCDRYSRRLVHADPDGRFMVVAMTWGVGHYTALHDHAGVWCVELVADGEMEIVDYQLLSEEPAGRCRFRRVSSAFTSAGSSGGLIPPFEHHVFGNRGLRPSHTLHIYGGRMDRCDVFEPVPGGSWQRTTRELKFDE